MERINWIIAAVLLSSMAAGAAMAAEQAGVTAAVRGEVNLDPVTGEAVHAAASGEDVFLGDGISSGDQSGLQLMLLDETIFTVGPNTDLTIDDFVYDPATGAGRMSASLTKGIFRFVAGNIAQGDAEDMTINLPTGTIGIRGTTGVVAMLDESLLDSDVLDFLDPGEGILTGSVILAVLLETKKTDDPNQRGMVVSNQGESVELTKPGWGSFIVDGFPPTDPVFIPGVIDMGNFLGNLTPSGPPPAGPGAPLNDGNVGAGGTFNSFVDAPFPAGLIGQPTRPDPRIIEEDGGPIDVPGGCNGCIPTFDDIFALQGTALYNASGTFTQTQKLNNPVNIQGTFSATLDIDFTNRKFCFGGCSISVDTSSFGGNISDSTGVNTIDFSNDVGLAGGVLDSDDLTNPNFADTAVGLVNTNGLVANQFGIQIFYNDGSGNQGSGSGLSDPASFSQ